MWFPWLATTFKFVTKQRYRSASREESISREAEGGLGASESERLVGEDACEDAAGEVGSHIWGSTTVL